MVTDVAAHTRSSVVLTQDELGLFQDLAYRQAGLRITDQKLGLVQNRLRGRVAARGCADFAAYHQLVCQPSEEAELHRCIEALTTNETFFFRHKAHWDHLVEHFLPAWQRSAGAGRSLRAWCAAASTGAEPYSLAMVLRAALPATNRFSIEASDINSAVLERARGGLFDDYALQKVSPAGRAAAFTQRPDGRWRIAEELRSAVRFYRHNLMHAHDGEPVDLIFLRNVLIYFDEHSKRQVLDHLDRRMRPGGLLFLGGSETMGAEREDYEVIGPAIYRRRAD